MSEQNTNRPDPIDTFRSYQERKQIEQALTDYKWSYDEVETLRTHDSSAYAALRPYISESHKRGDYRAPWELSRKDAQAYLEQRGIKGEVWSTGEVRALTQDENLFRDYGDEIKRAQKEGRLITGPDTAQGAVYHFDGENLAEGPGHERFKNELNKKLVRIDQHKKAAALAEETQTKLNSLIEQGLDVYTVRRFLDTQLKEIEKLDSAFYPVRQLDGYNKISEALGIADAHKTETVKSFGDIYKAAVVAIKLDTGGR